MTREELRVELKWFCGCGCNQDAALFLHELLKLAPFYENHDELRRLLPTTGLHATGLFYATLYWVDHLGYLEHGSSIGGSWLTEKGKETLEALDREYALGTDDEGDHYAALFPEMGSCVHGYWVLDEDNDHDCMAASLAEDEAELRKCKDRIVELQKSIRWANLTEAQKDLEALEGLEQ